MVQGVLWVGRVEDLNGPLEIMQKVYKYFIITIDTEGDNLWGYKKGDSITTRNSKYIPRFQELCEKYNFQPVYLTNYEMLCDEEFVEYIREKEKEGLCEVGLHLHAWNNPPTVDIDGPYSGNPYLIEYSDDDMRAKFDYLYKLFCEKMGHKPVSHRSGRWAMDERYFKLLAEYGVKIDCSVTPHVDWSQTKGVSRGGSDYRASLSTSHIVDGVCEVPLTVVPSRMPFASSLKGNLRRLISGCNLQLRPAVFSLNEMEYVIDYCLCSRSVDYAEFMMHSSELMPGGSPYFADEASIESMYADLERLFQYVTSKGFYGSTLREYYDRRERNLMCFNCEM